MVYFVYLEENFVLDSKPSTPIPSPCYPGSFARFRRRIVTLYTTRDPVLSVNYISWAVVALGAYSLVAPLMKVATTGQGKIPSDVAALVANSVLVVGTVGVIVVSGQSVTDSVVSSKLPYVLGAGVCLAVGILAYYRALALGPVSIVAPIFGMFLALSSVVGIVALGEPLTVRKAAGIGFAVLAIALVSID